MSDLAELLERVKAATGPDRGLDAAIWAQIQGIELTLFEECASGSERIGWQGALRYPEWLGPPKVTASLDAALALVERVLPGWTIAHIGQHDDKTWWAELREGHLTSYGRVALSEYAVDRRPKTPPLALLAALLSALIAQPASGDVGSAKLKENEP